MNLFDGYEESYDFLVFVNILHINIKFKKAVIQLNNITKDTDIKIPNDSLHPVLHKLFQLYDKRKFSKENQNNKVNCGRNVYNGRFIKSMEAAVVSKKHKVWYEVLDIFVLC